MSRWKSDLIPLIQAGIGRQEDSKFEILSVVSKYSESSR
jgi:hypothetical protein